MVSALNFDPFPVLTTERLILRRITPDDAPRVFEMRNNNDIMRYIEKRRPRALPETLEMIARMEEALSTNTGITWAICLKQDPMLIGTIGFWRIETEHFRAEIGYMLEPEFQRKGIMQEALEVCIKYAFTKMGIHSIEARLNPDNLASENLLKKNAFVQEAYFKENFFFEGKFLDTLVYSLVNNP